jgi:hypothetical protein
LRGRYRQREACPRALDPGGGTALHALTWREAWTAYEPKVPAAELAQRAPELALDYDFACRVIADRIAFLARCAGRPFPD